MREDTIIELKNGGLEGIEVYYDSYSLDQIELLLRLSNTYQLIPTGGSDFHGIESGSEIWLGAIEVPLESARRLLALSLQ